MLFRIGCLMGMTGYMPLYLREQGWSIASADGTLAAFYGISTVCVVPLCFLSDRIGSRKAILYPGFIVTIISFALLPIAEGGAILVLVLLAGIFVDGFASISITMLLETRGLRLIHSGIAVGTVLTLTHIGNFAIPPLGNSLATISPGAPFFLWSALSVLSLGFLVFIKETGWRSKLKLSK